MKIGKNDVLYVGNLARLDINDNEIDTFAKQLSDILLYVDKLNEIDTNNVEPMAHAVEINNAFRDDVVENVSGNKDSLSNAPEKDEHYFKVPKII